MNIRGMFYLVAKVLGDINAVPAGDTWSMSSNYVDGLITRACASSLAIGDQSVWERTCASRWPESAFSSHDLV